jgi:hypothetical protein
MTVALAWGQRSGERARVHSAASPRGGERSCVPARGASTGTPPRREGTLSDGLGEPCEHPALGLVEAGELGVQPIVDRTMPRVRREHTIHGNEL